ncbi:hypothetical protein [Marinobacterium jannaschii]|uniref:hypothetical protein n=1 Tax=Marinobacterium jannaschii TaxID=64970 RepID=UPI000488E74A|nr:hypothetical protein [Marinobacterium jannaschii]
MKTLTTSIVLGLALVSGAASAASYGYGENPSVEQSQLGAGINFESNTHFIDNERVELNSFVDSDHYDPSLYTNR